MHCEITDCYFNKFFVELQIKRDNLKSVFWVPEFGHQNPIYRSPKQLEYVTTNHDGTFYFKFLTKYCEERCERDLCD